MTKNIEQIIGRRKLIAMCVNDPAKGAEYIRRASETIAKCTTLDQITKNLAELLFLSESTVLKDLYAENLVKTEKEIA